MIKGEARTYDRYMDDILLNIAKDRIEAELERINLLHPKLKFTIERETDGRLPFLDLCIVHTNDDLYTTWYTKPTDTGLVMNFHAIAPRKYKRAVVQGLVYQIYRSCSKWQAFHDSIQRAKVILENNQYPPEFYDNIISMTLEKIVAGSIELPSSPDRTEEKSYILTICAVQGQRH